MSRLEKIRESLYQRKPSAPEEPSDDSSPLPPTESSSPVPPAWSGVRVSSPSLLELRYLATLHPWRRTTRVIMAGSVIILLALAAFIGYTLFFPSQEVSFTLVGPRQITVVEATTFTVRIVNRGNVPLREGVLTLVFPPGSLSSASTAASFDELRERITVDDIPAGGELEKDVSVKLLGAMGHTSTISGTYVYRPENIQSELTRHAEWTTTVTRVPIAVSLESPEEVSSGQDVTLMVGIDSDLRVPLPDMSLGIDFPSGFELKSTDPEPAIPGKNIWPLTHLEPGTSRTITLRGTMKGEPKEVKTFHLRLGRYQSSTNTWFTIAEAATGPTIASPWLLAQTTVNGNRQGSIVPGARLEGSVFFKNNLERKIQNVVMSVSFPEKFVELGSIQAERGFYDVTARALKWSPASDQLLEELEPGAEGTLAFSFVVKSVLPINTFADKDFSFPIVTTINTLTPPSEFRGTALEYRETIQFKIESPINVIARATYYDAPIENSGPLPPQVRKTTTYSVFFQLASGGSDLRNVEVRAHLPGGVSWQKEISTDRGTMSFNPASQEIVWRIPELSAATGIVRSPLTAVIQIGLTPADNQINASPVIVRAITASGEDVFSNTTQSDTAEDLTIEIRTDTRTDFRHWRVEPQS